MDSTNHQGGEEPTQPAHPPTATTAPEVLGPVEPLGVAMDVGAMLDQLEREARKGKLPGFERLSGPWCFEVEAYAVPFTGVMKARAEREGDRTVLRFETRISPKMPLIWLMILLVTIWPGLPLTENLIEAVGPAGWWRYTIWWYLPLSVISLPWAIWSGLRRSKAMMHASAHTARSDIARALGLAEATSIGKD
ncbi:MAG: hypothetical protein IBJ18_02630 [Phycisphaerales bacterium]|nr:hypothetical protein [Phycisphaerales bacterium]